MRDGPGLAESPAACGPSVFNRTRDRRAISPATLPKITPYAATMSPRGALNRRPPGQTAGSRRKLSENAR